MSGANARESRRPAALESDPVVRRAHVPDRGVADAPRSRLIDSVSLPVSSPEDPGPPYALTTALEPAVGLEPTTT